MDAVEFFAESMQELVDLGKKHAASQSTIDALQRNKDDLTTKWYDLERMLVETSTNLLKLRQSEHEQAQLL